MRSIISLLCEPSTSQFLLERWVNSEGGMLGLSLTLNAVLLGCTLYLLRLVLARDTEHQTRLITLYEQLTEALLDSTKAMAELSTLIKSKML